MKIAGFLWALSLWRMGLDLNALAGLRWRKSEEMRCKNMVPFLCLFHLKVERDIKLLNSEYG